jgi:hypothetical protein
MADPNLTESAWQRAKQDAARIYPSTEFEVAAALMTIIAGAIAAVAAAGENITTQIAAPIIGGALALLVTFGVAWFVQLAAAPVRQRNELRDAWSVPEIETVNVDLALRDAFRKGNDLAKFLEQRQAYSRGNREEAQDWADDVVALLAGNVPDEAARDFLATGGGESSFVRQLRQQVTALQKIIDGLG